MTSIPLGQIVYSFIEDHLKAHKGLRPLSIKSYRDTLRLFLIFAARDAGRGIARLSLEHLTFERVVGFLRHLEGERRNLELPRFDGHSEKRKSKRGRSERWRRTEDGSGGGFRLNTRPRPCS